MMHCDPAMAYAVSESIRRDRVAGARGLIVLRAGTTTLTDAIRRRVGLTLVAAGTWLSGGPLAAPAGR